MNNDKQRARAAFGAVLAACFISSLQAIEARPTKADDIRAAMTRAHDLRKKASGFNPLVAQTHALLLKSGDVRCGHAIVKVEKSGDSGAVYKLEEQFKAAMDDGLQSVVIDYAGTYALDAGLALVSGECSYQFDNMKNDGTRQKVLHTAKMRVKNGKIEWEAAEKADGDKEALKLDTKPVDLHGVMPIPRSALVAFVALAGSQPNFKPNVKEAYCLPVLDVDWETNTLMIEPAWISVDEPIPAFSQKAPPKGTAMQMRVRSLVGEVTEKGLEVETPVPEIWHNPQVWALDEKFRPLAHPVPDDVRINVEPIAPEKLKTDEPLDLSRIAQAMKEAVEKTEKEAAGSSKDKGEKK